jgi:FKBP-type peptidyl-prolyl cis-trans isomerase
VLQRLGILIPALILATACSSDREAEQPGTAAGAAAEESSMSQPGGPPPLTGDTVTTDSGLKYIVIRSGDGPTAEPGQVVSVQYTGWFTDGRKFDSSVDRNEPIRFPVGTGHVIPGWDEAVGMMKVGDKWRLIIPPDLAYGEQGHPAGIPPNSTLIFDVELVGVDR